MSKLLAPIRQATTSGKQSAAIVEAYYNGLATVRLVGGTRLTGLHVVGPTPRSGDSVIVDYSGSRPIVLSATPPSTTSQPLTPDLSPELTNINEANSNVLMSTLVLSNSTYGKVGTFLSGSSCVFGDAVCFNSLGKMELSSAAPLGLNKCVALCGDSIVSGGANGLFLLEGFINNSAWSWTPGSFVYVSIVGTSGNTLTQTQPVSTDNATIIVGIAYTSTILYFRPQLVIPVHV